MQPYMHRQQGGDSCMHLYIHANLQHHIPLHPCTHRQADRYKQVQRQHARQDQATDCGPLLLRDSHCRKDLTWFCRGQKHIVLLVPIRRRILHIYIHNYIHTDTETVIHSYIHTVIHTYIHAYIHTYTHACMHACMHTYIEPCHHTTIQPYIYCVI